MNIDRNGSRERSTEQEGQGRSRCTRYSRRKKREQDRINYSQPLAPRPPALPSPPSPVRPSPACKPSPSGLPALLRSAAKAYMWRQGPGPRSFRAKESERAIKQAIARRSGRKKLWTTGHTHRSLWLGSFSVYASSLAKAGKAGSPRGERRV
ncbi:hypothetical protein Mapa_003150 [Marchantia paleacea]|nr:hypothetical protein Mapa_003150 [Marchantia paleacea]